MDNVGVDRMWRATVHFHNRRLTEDQDLYVREGDFVRYGDTYYEIVSWQLNKQLFGQIQHTFEITAECIRARDGLFNAS
mgnify:FL=1